MDFIVGLPKTSKGFNAIWVIVDKITKVVDFLLIHISYALDKLAQLYVNEIVRLHGIPTAIVSDGDP